MDENKNTETTKLIEGSCGSDFDGTIKRTNSTQETVIHQTNASSLVQQTRKEPTTKYRTHSFWVADTYTQLNVATVSSRSDDKEPYITGMAFLKDGQLVACDKNNMSIKLFNRDLIMTYELYVGATPYDVAEVEEGIVIASFPDSGMLRYIVTKPGVKLGQRIEISETCLGITVRKSQIYVCIREGNVSKSSKQRFNGIRVLSMKGKLIHSISHQGSGFAKHVCVSEDGKKIFYTGGEGKDAVVNCVTKDGHGVFRFSDEMLQSSAGIALDRYGNVVTGDIVNGVLYVINSDGAKRKYLSDSNDKTKISSIAFNAYSGLLVVAKFVTLKAYFLVKPNGTDNVKMEISYGQTKMVDETKCCVLI